MTVNHGVLGSSPRGGAKEKGQQQRWPFLFSGLFQCHLPALRPAFKYQIIPPSSAYKAL
jgi:hypothetical protein